MTITGVLPEDSVLVVGAARPAHPATAAHRCRGIQLERALCRFIEVGAAGEPPAVVRRTLVQAVVEDLGFAAAAIHVVDAVDGLAVVTCIGCADNGFGRPRSQHAWREAIAAGRPAVE